MIQIKEVNKAFQQNPVISAVSIDIRPGLTYGLIGKNGAGKSTLINLILDLLPVDSGNIHVFGRPSTSLAKSEKRRIGAMPETLPILEELNAKDYLTFVGKVYGIEPKALQERSSSLFEYFFDSDEELKKSIGKYSHGMKKKIAFCGAVMHRPDILILDEPFSGLDPVSARLMIDFLKQYQNGERALLISSHDLAYVEQLATHIAILHDHSLVFNGSLQELTSGGRSKLDDTVLQILNPGKAALKNFNWL